MEIWGVVWRVGGLEGRKMGGLEGGGGGRGVMKVGRVGMWGGW